MNPFNTEETIVNLCEYVGYNSFFEIVAVLYNDNEYAKPGCFVNAQSCRQKNDVVECKNELSEILSNENIQHTYSQNENHKMVWIGNTQILPNDYDEHIIKSKFNSREHFKIKKFIGIPKYDNIDYKNTEQPETTTYPKDTFEISDRERYYLRQLSWFCAPTKSGLERAKQCGKERTNALKNAISTHPEYKPYFIIALHKVFHKGSGKFYGSFSEEYSKLLAKEYQRFKKEIPDDSLGEFRGIKEYSD